MGCSKGLMEFIEQKTEVRWPLIILSMVDQYLCWMYYIIFLNTLIFVLFRSRYLTVNYCYDLLVNSKIYEVGLKVCGLDLLLLMYPHVKKEKNCC